MIVLILYFPETENRLLYVVSVHVMIDNENMVVIILFLMF